jgi:kynurenine formamidase
MCAPSILEDVQRDLSRRHIHDLTHTITSNIPVFPILKPMQIVEKFTIARDGFYSNELTLNEHTGTHMDAPIHFVPNGDSVDRIAVDRLFAPLAIVSIKARADKDADTTVQIDDLVAWEKRHGRLPARAFVAIDSGWDARIGDPHRFLNRDATGTMHFPGFSPEAARNLGNVPPAGATLVVGGPKHQGGSGGPVRAFAVA